MVPFDADHRHPMTSSRWTKGHHALAFTLDRQEEAAYWDGATRLKNNEILQSGSVRDVLRTQTRDRHERLHEHHAFVGLFNQSLTIPEYRDLLWYFHGFYKTLDQAVVRTACQMGAPYGEYSYDERAGYLAQDLLSFGVAQRALDDAPGCASLEKLVMSETLGGVLYVVEGSTLGAASIDRAAQKLLGRNDSSGRRFWAWSRAGNAQRWARTNRYLDHLHATGTPMAGFERGANGTFEALSDWLRPIDRPFLSKISA